MDKYTQDLDRLKKEIWAIRNQLGENDSSESDQIKNSIAVMEQTIAEIESDLINVDGVQSAFEERLSLVESKISAGGMRIGDVLANPKYNASTAYGYIDFIVSDTKKIRFLFGVASTTATVTFAEPFDSIICFHSSYNPTAATSMSCMAHRASLGAGSTTGIKFLGANASASYARYSVWGYMSV